MRHGLVRIASFKSLRACWAAYGGVGVLVVDSEFAQWSNAQFKGMDVFAVELHEANELSNILD
jgi:hypothetical protein